MSFLNPLFLIALLSVGIPLLIYLLNIRKPKRIRFSTLAFFESLKQSSLRKIKLKRWLLLALRILAIAALAFALARPFLPSGLGLTSKGEPAVIGIIVDNGPAMEQIDRNGPYIEQARELAREIVNMQASDSRYSLNVTHGGALGLPLLSNSAAIREIGELTALNAGNYIAENFLKSISQVEAAPEPNKIVYIITDARESQINALQALEREDKFNTLRVELIKIGEAQPKNAGIQSVKLENTDVGTQLVGTVQNYGSVPTGSQSFSFNLDNELVSQQMYNIEAGQSRDFRFTLPDTDQKYQKAELLIEGDELSYDNRMYAAIQHPENRDVLVVNDERNENGEFTSYLRPLLEAVSEEHDRLSFRFETLDTISAEQLQQTDAVVLDGVRSIPDYIAQSLVEFVQSGNGLLLLPAAEGRIESYNQLLGISNAGRYSELVGQYGSFRSFDQLATPERGHPILAEMFDAGSDNDMRVNVPELYYYYKINSVEGRATAPILLSNTGNIILNETSVGSGKLIYSAIGSDPGWSNFPIKPLFAPLFYETVDYLAGGEQARLNVHTLGEPFEITIGGAAPGGIQLQFGDENIIPETQQTFSGLRVSHDGQDWTPGWLRILNEKEEKVYSVNQDAMESSLKTLDEETVDTMLSEVFENAGVQYFSGSRSLFLADLKRASVGKEVWYWFIIIAIFLLFTESMVSRYFKAETIS